LILNNLLRTVNEVSSSIDNSLTAYVGTSFFPIQVSVFKEGEYLCLVVLLLWTPLQSNIQESDRPVVFPRNRGSPVEILVSISEERLIRAAEGYLTPSES